MKSRAAPVLDAVVQDFPAFEDGLFKVAEDGRIYRLRKDGKYELATQCKTGRNGRYSCVSTFRDGKQKSFYVHRLVATAYVPNPQNKPEVNHKDGNGLNNHYTNLEWATRAENVKHAYDNGLIPTKFTAGIPCMMCGELTLTEDRICRMCKVEAKLQKRRLEQKELAAEEILRALDNVDIESLPDRSAQILIMRSEGRTLEEIGQRYGLTRERIRQIINKALYHPKFRTPLRVTQEQINLAEYVKYMGFSVSVLSQRLDIPYSTLRKCISLEQGMPEHIFTAVAEFAKYSTQSSAEKQSSA